MQVVLRGLLVFIGYWPLVVLHALGWFTGTALWWFPNSLRRGTRIHVELCLPGTPLEQRRRIARRSLIESMKGLLEAPAIWFGPRWRLRRWMGGASARDAMRKALAQAPSAIFLTPHLGSWELAGQFVAEFSRVTVLYKPQDSVFDPLILAGRARNPNARLVPTTTGGVKALLGALRNGEAVGILPDHDPPPGSGRFAPFFGIPAHTTDLVGKLAARTDAGVWFLVAERRPWARGFQLHLTPAPAGIRERKQSVAALNRGVEACILRLPEQYWWSYKRYRRQPTGRGSPYTLRG
ncbi:MAG TPA: hypothetical protein VF265_09770 [Nevskiaceae bacterium]